MKETFKTLGKDGRIEVLQNLLQKPKGIYQVYKSLHISEKNNINLSYVERVLKELYQSGLALRDNEKRYHISALGEALISYYGSIDPEIIFYLKNYKTQLPPRLLKEFPLLIPELSIAKEVAVIENLLSFQKEIEEEVLLILQKPFFSQKLMENNLELVKKGVRFRCILHPDNKLYLNIKQTKIDEDILNQHNEYFINNRGNCDIKTKFTSDINIHLYIADKKILCGGFADVLGDLPLNIGFYTYDKQAVDWGLKIFDHYWDSI